MAARRTAARPVLPSLEVWLRELSLGSQMLKSPTRKPTPSGQDGHKAAAARTRPAKFLQGTLGLAVHIDDRAPAIKLPNHDKLVSS